jgi:hypothetical protein
MEMDDGKITKFEEYKAIEKKHGKLEEVDDKYLRDLNDALSNFDDMEYDIEPAKEIMYKHIEKKYPSYTVADFGCIKLVKDTLVLKLRDETLRDNSYLFNTKTGEVYFINELIMNYINTSTCNNYNDVITKGIVKAQEHIDMVCLVMQFRSD